MYSGTSLWVLIFISLMINDIEQILMVSLITCES